MNNYDSTNSLISRDANNQLFGEIRHICVDKTFRIGFGTVSRSVGIEDDTATQIAQLELNGVTFSNSNKGKLYYEIAKEPTGHTGEVQIEIFKDAAKLNLVASGIDTITTGTTTVAITAENSSGITGEIIFTTANIADDTDAANIFVVPVYETNIVEIYATQACFVRFATDEDDAIATVRDYPVAAGERISNIHLRGCVKIGVIQSSTGGYLYITECE